MAHHQPNSHMIRRGSTQHAVLRLLDSCELSCVDTLAVVGENERSDTRMFHRDVLAPLKEQGLLHWDRQANTWGATDEGSAVARKLGPLDGELLTEKAAAAPLGPGLTPQYSGRRQYLGIGDMRPPALRPGSEDAARLPSRMGDRLHWPDGRVSDLTAGAAS